MMFNEGEEALLRYSKADEDDLSEEKSNAYAFSSIVAIVQIVAFLGVRMF